MAGVVLRFLNTCVCYTVIYEQILQSGLSYTEQPGELSEVTLGRAGADMGYKFGWYISVLWPCRSTDCVVLAKGGAVGWVIICLCVLFLFFVLVICFVSVF